MVLKLSLKDTLSNISFCDKQCSNLNNNNAKEELINYIQQTYNIEIIKKTYVTLNPHMLRNITHHQHILSTLTNGNNYLLFLTKLDGINCCFFIDRKLKNGYSYPKIHCVKYRFDSSLFEKETIFNGELIRDQNRDWFFIVSDILLYKGKSTKDSNILSRFEIIHNIFENEYQEDEDLEICPLQVKRLFQYKDINTLINDFIPNLSYICKGIVFNTLGSFSDYALILPKERQPRINSQESVDQKIKEKYPELLINPNNNFISQEDNNSIIQNDNKLQYNTVVLKKDEITNNQSNLGTQDSKIQIDKNNVVFKILKTETPDIYQLYYLDGKNLCKYNYALIPNIKTSLMLYNLFNENLKNNKLDIIMECKFSKIFSRWIPIREVTNKPFQISTIKKMEERLSN